MPFVYDQPELAFDRAVGGLPVVQARRAARSEASKVVVIAIPGSYLMRKRVSTGKRSTIPLWECCGIKWDTWGINGQALYD